MLQGAVNSEYSIEVNQIPTPPKDGCPMHTDKKTRVGTCSCEEHCSWDLCRLKEPPDDCLFEARSEWTWDYKKNAWVAQLIKGANTNHKNDPTSLKL